MSDSSETKRSVKGGRRYRSPLRDEQAQHTRDRILAAARVRFVSNGYSGATIAGIAEEAGVSAETVYSTFGGKRGLLEGVIETAITNQGAMPSYERHWLADIASVTEPYQRLSAYVTMTAETLARTSPIHAVIRGAADKETFAAEFRHQLLSDRLAIIIGDFEALFAEALRPELTVEDAGQRYTALASPELHHLLITDLGWTLDQHRRWLEELAQQNLLA